ncbi:MAG: hypothetical protein MJZ37_08605 [Bacilli bacterium]|nr:hypothetical protein [Bacilli bacterium]
MNDDIDRWLDRIQVLIDFQKHESLEIVTARFTRADLISLSVLLGSLKELKEQSNTYTAVVDSIKRDFM